MVLMVQQAECSHVEKTTKDTRMLYFLEVNWQNQPPTSIMRTFLDFFDFTATLKSETKGKGIKGITIPALPSLKWFQRLGNATEKRKAQVNAFCKDVIGLTNLLTSPSIEEEVRRFFAAWEIDLTSVQKDNTKVDKPKVKDKDKVKQKKKEKKEENKRSKKDIEKVETPVEELKAKLSLTEEDREVNPDDQFIVSTDYLEPEEGQILLHESDVVEVLERTLSGWWYVVCEDDQREGWAPAAILEPLDPYGATNDVQSENVVASGGLFRSRTQYKATKDDELTYNKGQVMEVVRKSLDGWWTVILNGKTGLVSAPNLEKESPPSRDLLRDVLYETHSKFQQHSIYQKKPPPRRDPNLCLDDLYAKVEKTKRFPPGPRPEPLSPKPKLNPNQKAEVDYIENAPEVPDKTLLDSNYTEIVFDDDSPTGRTTLVEPPAAHESVTYTEVVLNDPAKPRSPQKQARTRPVRANDVTHNFQEAIQDYKPDKGMDGLRLKKYDIVLILQEKDNLIFCELCKQEMLADKKFQTGKGWVPKTVLASVKCEILREEEGVKYVRKSQPLPVSAPAPTQHPNNMMRPIAQAPKSSTPRPNTQPPKIPPTPQPIIQPSNQTAHSHSKTSQPIPPVTPAKVNGQENQIYSNDIVQNDSIMSKSSAAKTSPTATPRNMPSASATRNAASTATRTPSVDETNTTEISSVRRIIKQLSQQGSIENAPPEVSSARALPGSGGNHVRESYCNKAWFVGEMDRDSCKDYLAAATEGQFVIRQTKGEFSLSVASREKTRHFQIKNTDKGKYSIGGIKFKDLSTIIENYMKLPLYYADDANLDGRCLKEPFVKYGRF